MTLVIPNLLSAPQPVPRRYPQRNKKRCLELVRTALTIDDDKFEGKPTLALEETRHE